MVNVMGPGAKFPDESKTPGFKEAVTSFTVALSKVTQRVLKCLAIALGAPDEDFFVNMHKYLFKEDSICRLRSLYYPSINGKILLDCLGLK